jgi:hypothetical protein
MAGHGRLLANRYRAGEAHRPKIHVPLERSRPVSKRDIREWAKMYLGFFDLGPSLRFAKTTKKISDSGTPRLFDLTINQCHAP